MATDTPPHGADDVVAPRAPDRDPSSYNSNGRLRESVYAAELARLQEQLVLLQYWIQRQGLKAAV